MKPALFSQSLFALPLEEAIAATAEIGFEAIELACAPPHFDLDTARRDAQGIVERIRSAGLTTAALSLFNNFTDASVLEEAVGVASAFIRLAPLFDADIVKLTPGSPASADATEAHWRCLGEAVSRLVPVAQEAGVRLAFETHMRQLTDTVAASHQFLELGPAETVGLTVDFSNLAFAGEAVDNLPPAIVGRMYHAHVKNGYIDATGGWHFQALDHGLTDYQAVFHTLRRECYNGYLSVECLGPDAAERPRETARRDLLILKNLLAEHGAGATRNPEVA